MDFPNEPGEWAKRQLEILIRARFWARVKIENDCWIWQGAKDRHGYGRFRIKGVDTKTALTHRQAYEWEHGPIPAGLVLDHLCRRPGCVRPSHLEAVTQSENVKRSLEHYAPHNVADWQRAKTTCPKGHAYDTTLPNGGRACSICTKEGQDRRNGLRKKKVTL